MKNYIKVLISALLVFGCVNSVLAEDVIPVSTDVNNAAAEVISEPETGAVEETPEITDNSAAENVESDIQTTEAISQEEKSIADKALTPVGWLIGGAIAPVYLGIDFTKDAVEWSVENVVEPIGDGISWSYDYIIEPVGKGIVKGVGKGTTLTLSGIGWTVDKTFDGVDFICKYTVVPAAKLGIDATKAGFDYVIVPVGKGLVTGSKYTLVPMGKGLVWCMEKTFDGIGWAGDAFFDGLDWVGYNIVEPIGEAAVDSFAWTASALWEGAKFGAKYTLVPTAKGVAWSAKTAGKGIKVGSQYTIVPVAKGVKWGAETAWEGAEIGARYTIIPVAKGVKAGAETIWSGLETGAKYTLVPIGKSVVWTADAVGDGIEWTGEKVVAPVAKSIGTGVEKTLTPINNAAKAVTEKIKSLRKNRD